MLVRCCACILNKLVLLRQTRLPSPSTTIIPVHATQLIGIQLISAFGLNPRMRLDFQTLALALCYIGGQSFAPPRTHISCAPVRRWSQPLLSTSSSELSGLLNEYKSVASPASTTASTQPSPPVTTVITPPNDDFAENSMRSLTDAVSAATDAADAAAQAAAAAMAAASKVS